MMVRITIRQPTLGTPLRQMERQQCECCHSAVWTGNEMIIWGGYYNDGSDVYRGDGIPLLLRPAVTRSFSGARVPF